VSRRATDPVEARAAVTRRLRSDAEEDFALVFGFVLHL
jgi:hypothetical protein